MSAESNDMVREHLGPEYDQLEIDADPLRLWEAIRTTHVAFSTGCNPADAARIKASYISLKQHPGKNLSSFKDRIDTAVKATEAIGLPDPNGQELAADFLTKVNAAYEAKAMLIENSHRLSGAYPQTLYEASQRLSEIVTERTFHVSQQSVFKVSKPQPPMAT